MKIQLENYFKVVNQCRRNFGTRQSHSVVGAADWGLKRLDPKDYIWHRPGVQTRKGVHDCRRLSAKMSNHLRS